MKSRSRLILDSIINASDNLLIVVPPFINSLLTAIALLMERFRRGLLTHITLLTLESLDELGDVISRYNSILLIEPPTVIGINNLVNALNGRRVLIISRENIDWVNADALLEFNDSMPQFIWQLLNDELSQESMRFIEAAVSHEFYSIPDYNVSLFNGWTTTEPINYPALPGILRLPLSESLARSISPVIPGVTGNEAEARSLVKAVSRRVDAMYGDLGEDEVMTLLRYIGDFILRAGFRGDYLDKLVLMNRRWVGTNIDVLESILAIESQLALWEYAGGLVNPIINPQSVKDVDNLITKYVGVISELMGQLDREAITIGQGYQLLTLIDRLCSIMSFKAEGRNRVFSTEDGSAQVMCILSGDVPEADLVFRRNNYLIAVKGLRNDSQG